MYCARHRKGWTVEYVDIAILVIAHVILSNRLLTVKNLIICHRGLNLIIGYHLKINVTLRYKIFKDGHV